MSFDLTNKNIQDTFQNLLQRTGSDNRLYDLLGNEIGDLRISGSLTAQQYIVSSSVTNISIATLSGSTTFGNSSDDTHLFTGNITASGDISSSGNLATTNITSSGHFIGQLPPDGGDNVLRYLKTSGDATAVKIEMGDLTGDAGGGTKLVLDDDATKVDITGNLLVSGILSSSGDLTSRAGTIERGFIINSDGGSHATVIRGLNDDNLFLANTNPSGVDKIAIGTTSFLSKLTIGGDLTTTSHITASGNIKSGGNLELTASSAGHITASGNISASGNIFANSGSFNYITASIIDVDGDTIRFGGEPFTRANIQTLKLGRTLKPVRSGKSKPDIEGDEGIFDSHITASGNISASGIVFGSDIQSNGISVVKAITDLSDNITNQGKIQFTNTANVSVVKNISNLGSGDSPTFRNITVSGDITNTKIVQMTNSSSVINTFNTGSIRSSKYMLQVISASNYQVSEMLVLHNDGTTLNTEYAQLNSGVNLVDFSTKVNNSNVELIASSSFISCSIEFERTIIPI